MLNIPRVYFGQVKMKIIKALLVILFFSCAISFDGASARKSRQGKNRKSEIRNKTIGSTLDGDGSLYQSGSNYSSIGTDFEDKDVDLALLAIHQASLQSKKRLRSRQKKYRRRAYKTKSHSKRKNRRTTISPLNVSDNQKENQDFETDVSERTIMKRTKGRHAQQITPDAASDDSKRADMRSRKSRRRPLN